MIPSPMLMRGFVYPQHCPYPTGLFNHVPQSCRPGITSTGDYIFSLNVVSLTLRLVNLGLLLVRHFSDGLLTASFVDSEKYDSSMIILIIKIIAINKYDNATARLDILISDTSFFLLSTSLFPQLFC